MKLKVRDIEKFLIFLYCFFAFCISPEVFPLCNVIMMMLATALLMMSFFVKDKLDLNCKNTICICLLLITNIISNIANEGETLGSFFLCLRYISIIIALLTYGVTRESLEEAMRVIMWIAFVGGPVAGFIQILIGDFLLPYSETVLFDASIITTLKNSNPNYTAISMLFCILFAGYFYLKNKERKYGVVMLLSSIALVLTFSRTAIAVLGVFLLCWLIYRMICNCGNMKLSYKTLLLSVVFFVVLTLFVGVNFNLTIEKLNLYLEELQVNVFRFKTAGNLYTRFEQWKASAQIIFEGNFYRFLFGYGEMATAKMGEITGRAMTSHNFIFGRMAENGMMGLVLALVIYINCIREAWLMIKKKANEEAWFVLGVVFVLICYLMISIYTYELLVLLALIDGLGRCNNKKVEASDAKKRTC